MPLNPHHIGQRVVVRRVLPGETGPTGGPALTDVLGVLESWADGVLAVRREDDSLVSIPVADVVLGKPVPPRPSVRHRISAARLEAIAAEGWPAPVQQPLGDWLLRWADGFTQRANSALAVDPADPSDQSVTASLDEVVQFYTSRSARPVVQVVVGSDTHLAVEQAGWVPARPNEADTCFQIASVARTLRSTRARIGDRDLDPRPTIVADASDGWLALYANAAAMPDQARAVLEGPEIVGFASIGDPVIAIGRVAVTGDWAGIAAIEVLPEHRRRGLGLHLMVALLDWAAERGATSVYLQTRGDNEPALRLYDALGFTTHHEYRYLTPPSGLSPHH